MENRRSFFKNFFLILGGIGAGGIFYSLFKFFSHDKIVIPNKTGNFRIFDSDANAFNKESNSLNPIMNSDGSFEFMKNAIPKGQYIITAMLGIPLIFVHSRKGYRVFDATCTHLGCLVKWDESTNQFICPCHGGQYDKNGIPIAGPPPSALKEHSVSIMNNKVRVVLT